MKRRLVMLLLFGLMIYVFVIGYNKIVSNFSYVEIDFVVIQYGHAEPFVITKKGFNAGGLLGRGLKDGSNIIEEKLFLKEESDGFYLRIESQNKVMREEVISKQCVLSYSPTK
jgi:hypothetical protein